MEPIMKKVIFSRDVQPERGLKRFVLREKHVEPDNITHIKKTFSYQVARYPRHRQPDMVEPEVHVRKKADQQQGLEMVTFEVKGRIYTKHNHTIYEVNYHHTLNIHILRRKVFSPNNTALA